MDGALQLTVRTRRRVGVGIVAALLLAAAPPPARPASGAGRAGPARAAAVISPVELERRHGIRLLRVAVTAAGGLVDLRLRVVDPRKATPILRDPARAVRLLPEGGGRELFAPHAMAHSLSTRRDAVSYLLIPNVAGVIRPGTRLAVAFGEVRVAPLVAR